MEYNKEERRSARQADRASRNHREDALVAVAMSSSTTPPPCQIASDSESETECPPHSAFLLYNSSEPDDSSDSSLDENRPGPSQRPPKRRRRMDDRWTKDSDSEMELAAEDRSKGATEHERRTASEIANMIANVTQLCPEHGTTMMQQIVCNLSQYIPGMPNDARVALQRQSKHWTGWEITEKPITDSDGKVVGSIWYRGLKAAVLENLECVETSNVALDIFFDEAPLPQPLQPKLTSWVALGRLNEGTKLGYPFPITVFCGEGKPPVEEFLGPLCDEASEFVGRREQPRELVVDDSKSVMIGARIVITDATARSFVKGTVLQTANNGCTQCTIIGKRIASTTATFVSHSTFLPRTHEEFVTGKYDQVERKHRLRATPLEKFPIDIVKDVTVGDDRHLLHMGVMRTLLSAFVSNDGITVEESKYVTLVQNVLVKVQFPKERCGTVRYFASNTMLWTAEEWRYLFDVVSIVLFNHVGQPKLFEAFSQLHTAIAICNHARFSRYRNVAGDLIRDYLKIHLELFGNVTAYFHSLLHLVAEVERFGPLPGQSSYSFEADMSILRKTVDITKQHSPTHQAAMALLMRERGRRSSTATNFPYLTKRGVHIRKNFYLNNLSNDTDGWFMVAGSGTLSRGIVVKFVSATINPFVVYGRPLAKQQTLTRNPFKKPIGLDVFATTNKKKLQEKTEYKLEDIICKLCIVWMPGQTSFHPLSESFAEC